MKFYWAQLSLSFLLATAVSAGPAAYGVCQAGCASVVMACYSAAGFTWGATTGAAAPASIIACNSAFGTCQAASATLLLAPTLWEFWNRETFRSKDLRWFWRQTLIQIKDLRLTAFELIVHSKAKSNWTSRLQINLQSVIRQTTTRPILVLVPISQRATL